MDCPITTPPMTTYRKNNLMEVGASSQASGVIESSQTDLNTSQMIQHSPICFQVIPLTELDISSQSSSFSNDSVSIKPISIRKFRKRKGYGAKKDGMKNTNRKRRLTDSC